MVDWPASLPQYILAPATDRRGPTRIRSEVDAGPAIVRRRYTAAVRRLRIPVRFTFDERETFNAFYITDLKEGTLSFAWTDPVTQSAVTMRFAGEEGPEFTGEGPFWTATLDLEILP